MSTKRPSHGAQRNQKSSNSFLISLDCQPSMYRAEINIIFFFFGLHKKFDEVVHGSFNTLKGQRREPSQN